ncbi:HU family DNA-binding protein [Gilvimarinus sp. SDUM040013]|uniref:HU family DNA-binding protein n=1 Tax=Gilvimarinus gilvus TaxID=3058038 RepID=A0ABU4RX99_9GAMM|nr:HU family DNA-binding protein [Gilvimarinus sp. SDUM040013]MDO3388630.1 HU family DNA-binding protein [Gilvimarinus sp. SDUM040013]MDX6849525.1 HU family DNA-binding protein [Gilvimarinus sp. SDUM040013]
MKKADLVAAISASARLSRAEADTLFEELWAQIALALGRGERIAISGLGTFEVRHRVARQQRHPQTGTTVHVAQRNVIGFRPAQALRSALQENLS